MRLWRLLAGGAAIAVVAGLQLATIPGASAVPETGDLNWHYHEEGGGYYREPEGGEEGGGGGGPSTVLFEVGSPWVCRHSADHQCSPPWAQGGTAWCGPEEGVPGTGPNGRPWFAHARFTREVPNPANPGPWTIDVNYGDMGTGADCVEVSDEDWVSLDEIRQWVVDYSIIRDLGEPEAVISPNPKALVNLPIVVYTTYPGEIPGVDLDADPVTLTIPINIPRPGGNLVGELRAEAKFTWTFEGRAGSVNGRGKKYTRTIDPRNDGGYYVKNTFTKTGSWNVHLNVLWTGEVDVDGILSQPIPPIEFDSDATVDVVESKPILGDR